MFLLSYHSTRIFETGNTQLIENSETNGSEDSPNMDIKKVRVQVLLVRTSSLRFGVPRVVESYNNQEQHQINDPEINNE